MDNKLSYQAILAAKAGDPIAMEQVLRNYAASSDPAAAHAVQNSLFNFQSSPQPIFCNNGESVR